MNSGGVVLAALALFAVAAGMDSAGTDAEAATSSGIPAEYRELYVEYGDRCAGLDWAVLAAVGKVESNHGRSPLPGVDSGENGAGAAGPMQFLSATWAEVHANNPDIGSSRYDPDNAIPATAAYLCAYGAAEGDTAAALYQYNHSHSYVAEVQAQARAYRAGEE